MTNAIFVAKLAHYMSCVRACTFWHHELPWTQKSCSHFERFYFCNATFPISTFLRILGVQLAVLKTSGTRIWKLNTIRKWCQSRIIRVFPKFIPAWLAPLFEPYCKLITCFPALICSSENVRTFASFLRGQIIGPWYSGLLCACEKKNKHKWK